MGWTKACAVTDGDLVCWGSDIEAWPAPIPLPRITYPAPASSIREPTRIEIEDGARAVGIAMAVPTCVLESTGRVVCFGAGAHEALGIGVAPLYRGRAEVALPEPVRELSTTGTRTCVLFEHSGGVACWGASDEKRVGPSPLPTRVTDTAGQPLRGMVRVAVDAAIDEEGHLFLWGLDEHGELHACGVPGPRTPREGMRAHRVRLARPLVDVERTETFVCALDETGEIECWGDMEVQHGNLNASGAPRRIPPARENRVR